MPDHYPVALLRRAFATLVLATGVLCAGAAHAFGFDDVAEQARARAAQPHRPPPTAPAPLLALDYDAYRDIRFRPPHAVWRAQGLPFELQFFHAGRGNKHPIRLYELIDGMPRPVALAHDAFDYGRAEAAAPQHPLVAGFRVHYPLNRPDHKDELIAFLGASYFRALGAGQRYGLSARGIAVDTTGGRGEEFPAFEAFWIERPAADARALTVYALLDGPRVTGAYRFVVRPGDETTVDVQARLYLRAPVAMLGIAPLTSMFLTGENQPRAGDFRPEVHDSDGLSVATAEGEWLWRPLQNPSRQFTTSFALKGVRGFGLMQRDRAFSSYEDTEARYERRPGVWVEPLSDWGQGRVELMQYRIEADYDDNTAAYWVPAQLPPPGQPLDMAWRLHWQGDAQTGPPGARVVQTRVGQGPAALKPEELQYVVDFAGGALPTLSDEDPVRAVVSVGANARLHESNSYRHPVTGGWRVTVRLERIDARRPVELRAFLKLGNDILSETWSYVIPPR
jgi:glucans biosynthesis protein